jgi:hypothetical protein
LEDILSQSVLNALGQQSTGAPNGAQADEPDELEDGALPSAFDVVKLTIPDDDVDLLLSGRTEADSDVSQDEETRRRN